MLGECHYKVISHNMAGKRKMHTNEKEGSHNKDIPESVLRSKVASYKFMLTSKSDTFPTGQDTRPLYPPISPSLET